MPDTKPAAPQQRAAAPLANQRVAWFNGKIVP